MASNKLREKINSVYRRPETFKFRDAFVVWRFEFNQEIYEIKLRKK